MARRRIYDKEGHWHYVTFSCDRKRRLLQHERAMQIVLGNLSAELERMDGRCHGFVLMPDHVHVILSFSAPDQLSPFMRNWKRKSSWHLRRFFESSLPDYATALANTKRLWRPKYYDFNLFSEKKLLEKITYMHENPVRAGLVASPTDWRYSSARWYAWQHPCGLRIGL